jgi:hypothetical protein
MTKLDYPYQVDDTDEFKRLADAVKRLEAVIAEDRKKKRERGKLITVNDKNSK